MNVFTDTVPWEEIEDAATGMFKVWSSGGELKWAAECWEYMEKDGLTSSSDLLEENMTYIRLVTLARIYQEFSGLMWDEDPETPIPQLAEDLEIDQLTLGVLARRDPEFDAEGFTETRDLENYALTRVSDSLRFEIYACLSVAYGGDAELYSRMARTIKEPDADDDEEDGKDDRDAFEAFSPTCRHSAALTFVCNGFRKD